MFSKSFFVSIFERSFSLLERFEEVLKGFEEGFGKFFCTFLLNIAIFEKTAFSLEKTTKIQDLHFKPIIEHLQCEP